VELAVRHGVIAAARIVGGLSEDDAAACAAALIGAVVDGFADGTYHGQMQVDPTGVAPGR